MTERLAGRDREVRELESTIVLAEQRAIEAEARVLRESRRANQAQERIAELQEALEIRKAQESDELAAWDGDLETVVDLLAWEDKVSAGAKGDDGEQRHA
jgi:hypothetical protein